MSAVSSLIRPEEYQLPEHAIPLLVQLGLTYRCNLKCSHCYALYRRDRDEFTLDEIADLGQQLYDAGSASVVYSHGENMIRRDFHECAQVFRDLDFHQTLMLNGYYVKKPEAAKKLHDSGIHKAMISIDSIEPDVHNQVRGKDGAFDVALRAIALLKESEMQTVGFSTTIDTHNYGDVEKIVDYAAKVGVDEISFMQNRYNRSSIFDRAVWLEYEQVCKRIYELILEYRGVVDIHTHDPFMLTILDDRLDNNLERADYIGANMCNVATNMVSIDPVGLVTGCNFIEESIGNVREEPFADIWERLVHRYSDTVSPPTGACTGCSSLSSCMGGCKAFHYVDKYDERCGEQRFGAPEPHGLAQRGIPVREPERAPGTFVGMPMRKQAAQAAVAASAPGCGVPNGCGGAS